MTHPTPKRRAKLIALAIMMTTILLVVANIVASTTVATTGKRLSELESEAFELETANSQLERDISLKRSFQSLEAYAKEAGLTAVTEVINLNLPEALAQAELDSAQAPQE